MYFRANLSNILLYFTLLILPPIIQSTKFYVNQHQIFEPNKVAEGFYDGSTWRKAYATLEAALDATMDKSRTGGDITNQIYLTAGIYTPNTTDRDNCFSVTTGVKIYGGFTNTSIKDPSEREKNAYSIISGDIGAQNDNSDNCYHVITYHKKLTLDQVIIANGNADADLKKSYIEQPYALHRYGGGLITFDSTAKTDLTLNRVQFINNTAIAGGALWFSANPNTPVNVLITYCKFIDNYALGGLYDGGYGGAIYLYFLARVNIENTYFTNNYAEFRGGAIYLDYGGILDVMDSSFIENTAGAYGGAIFSEDRNSQTNGTFPMIETSKFDGNYAGIYGGAICWFNYVEGVLSYNKFSQNVAQKKGGAIALFESSADYYDTNTFQFNVALNDAAFDDLYNEPNATTYDNFTVWPGVANITRYLIQINEYLSQLNDNWEKNKNELGYADPDGELTTQEGKKLGINYCLVDWRKDEIEHPTGEKWSLAFRDIQPCFEKLKTTGGGEIWVVGDEEIQRGRSHTLRAVYTPTEVPTWKEQLLESKGLPKWLPQERSFEMYPNIKLFGGFSGGESVRNLRNPFKYKTFLSGNLGNITGRQVYANQILMAADDVIIDGFIFIDAGYGPLLEPMPLMPPPPFHGNYTENNATNQNHTRRRLKNSISIQEVLDAHDPQQGSGIYSPAKTFTVRNSIFYKLFANHKGGALYCYGQDGTDYINLKYPTLENVAFVENRANLRGGAISADVGCDFQCHWCIFAGNECAQKGGAIYLDFWSSPKITQSEFFDNVALVSGGCIAADGESMVVGEDTIFHNNFAGWEGGCLYSGSGVGQNKRQGFDLYSFTIPTNQILNDSNHLLYNHIGHNNMYGWPFSFMRISDISHPPTPVPTPSPTIPALTDVPNFVIFIVDDMVYTERLGKLSDSPFFPIPDLPPSSKESIIDIELPNFENFTRSAVVFPRSYSGPKCSPSRFSVLTGRSPIHSEYAKQKTYVSSLSDPKGIEGTKVTVPFSRLSSGSLNARHNIPNVLKEAGSYLTGHIGKWHLMDKEDYPIVNGVQLNCDLLNDGGYDDPEADITYIYNQCKEVVKDQGFSFVEGYYHSNIDTENYDAGNNKFTHNPEWMQYHVGSFIDTAKKQDKPFFLYVAPTLTHDPSIIQALKDFNYTSTPGGEFEPDRYWDKYVTPYMANRSDILQRAKAWQALDGSNDTATLNKAAALLWVDQQFGAVVKYLGNLMTNTMFIFINDHGMGAKGLLYEQGIRIMQAVTYPEGFGLKWWRNQIGYKLPPDFITSTTDLASVIFELSTINLELLYPDYYAALGYGANSWYNDVLDYITYLDLIKPPEEQRRTYVEPTRKPQTCCQNRTIDVFNSHCIITENYKYIYRATNETEPSLEAQMYPYLYWEQQLYDLRFDSAEQNNFLDYDSYYITGLDVDLFLLRKQMINYISDEVCLADDKVACITPDIGIIPEGYEYIERTPSPTYYGYTCNSIQEHDYRVVPTNKQLKATDILWYRQKAETDFLTLFGDECGKNFTYNIDTGGNQTGIEYYYNVSKVRQTLEFKMYVCCIGTFGAYWQISDEYASNPTWFAPNEALLEKYPSAFKITDIFLDDENEIGVKGVIVISVLCFIFIVCVIMITGYYCWWKRGKQYEHTVHELYLIIDGKKNNKQTSSKDNNNTITEKQKAGIELAGYKEMEASQSHSSKNSSKNSPRTRKYSESDSHIDKKNDGKIGGLSPVPGSPPEAN